MKKRISNGTQNERNERNGTKKRISSGTSRMKKHSNGPDIEAARLGGKDDTPSCALSSCVHDPNQCFETHKRKPNNPINEPTDSSIIHPCIHSFIHVHYPSIHSHTFHSTTLHPNTYSLMHSPIHPLVRPSVHSSIHHSI